MNYLSLVAVVLSLAAVAISITYGPASPHTGNPTAPHGSGPHSTDPSHSPDISALNERVGLLAARVQELEKAKSGAVRSGAEGAVIAEATDSATIEEIKTSLDPHGLISAYSHRIDQARKDIADEELDVSRRISQARELELAGVYEEERVAAVRGMWSKADSVWEKRDVLGALEGHVTPDMRDEILQGLEVVDPNQRGVDRLYWASVDALKPLLPDPKVENWLLSIIQNSRRDGVANRAAEALGIEWEPAQNEQGDSQ